MYSHHLLNITGCHESVNNLAQMNILLNTYLILDTWKYTRFINQYGHPIRLLSSHLSPLTLEGTTDGVAAIPFHPFLSSAALRESSNPIPFHSLMLSSYLYFCLPLLLAPFTVSCRIVFAMPEDLETWPYHLSFRFFTMVRRSSCTPIAFWILLRTASFVTWSL